MIALEAELGLDTGVLVEPFRTGDAFAEAELGQTTVAECFATWRAAFEEQWGIRLRSRQLFGALGSAGEPNATVIDLVSGLAGRYRLAVLTNNIAEMRDRWQSLVPIELFETVIDSSEVGVRKPDPAVYQLLLDRLELEPHEVAFVDDTMPNVEAARKIGMLGIHFTSSQQLTEDLRRLGIE
ncbi:HAD-IA family hydrolase [Williamsia sp. DF01-3]|uniref:HAD-IA family hydrolase n=1 Tax=Williamsia sp. DF01-3 TaxID=2934157 RepID=UPI001FF16102|nr:HAD-IA family hydrolase [Williamsia sp. DF01-3]MCK0517338.1 HAD-IA family hydrolase [Williamsia sp. DF01-3]